MTHVMTRHEARDAARSDLAMLVERDLLNRFGQTTPGEALLIEVTGPLAAALALFDVDVRAFGADERAAARHTSMAASLTRGMEALGTARTAGSAAETILAQALATQDALLVLRPAAGSA
jgi:hypothetical protein